MRKLSKDRQAQLIGILYRAPICFYVLIEPQPK